MKPLIIAASAVAIAVPTLAATPASAQSREVRKEIRECQRELRRADSRREYDRERRKCSREIAKAQREYRKDVRQDRRETLRDRRRYVQRQAAARDWQRYNRYDWNRVEPGQNRYYADRYYRSGGHYADRRMSYGDRIYRGQNGSYYCRRSDGTTGLVVGAGLGALLGNRLNVGGSTTLSTVIGGAAGALIGREIARGRVRCN